MAVRRVKRSGDQVVQGASDVVVGAHETPDYYGYGYPNDRNKPSSLQILAELGFAGEYDDLTDGIEMWIDRESMSLSRTNVNGANMTADFDLDIPGMFGSDVRANRPIMVRDMDTPNGVGGPMVHFAGYTMAPESSQPADGNRYVHVRCVDYGILMQKPPNQIATQWPPGDGTPVVDATSPTTIAAGVRTITPSSMRHIYAGKKIFAQNPDGSNRERITVTSVTSTTFTATFASSKTSATTTTQDPVSEPGVYEIEPDSMANINVGANLFVYRTDNGDDDIGSEWITVTAVTATTFTAEFAQPKGGNWHIDAYWRVEGGLTDRELIADGWQQHVDTVDPLTGDITTSLVAVESLIDLCFNNALVPITVDKTLVLELIPSLGLGKWDAATPQDVMNWIVDQNADPSIQPSWYMSYIQPTSYIPAQPVPALRYYDALTGTNLAGVALTNEPGEIEFLEARYTDYSRPEDGQRFANRLRVLGKAGAIGEWNDVPSQSDPMAENYVGRVIEAPLVRDNNLSTNAACAARAVALATQMRLNVRKKSVRVDTYAMLDTRILYEPQVVNFTAFGETDPYLPADLQVHSVSLSFTDEGLAKYSFVLGEPLRVYPDGISGISRSTNNALLSIGRGDEIHVGRGYARTYDYSALADPNAGLHMFDTSGGEKTIVMPRAHLWAGERYTVINTGDNPLIVKPSPGGDTINGLPFTEVPPGGSSTYQSTGEYDEHGVGSTWREVANVYVPEVPVLSFDVGIHLGGDPAVPIVSGFYAEQWFTYPFTITGWKLVADQEGDAQLDIYAASDADRESLDLAAYASIITSNPPMLTADTRSAGTVTDADWEVELGPCWLWFEVVSAVDVTRLDLILTCTRLVG